jgi:MFS family permease
MPTLPLYVTHLGGSAFLVGLVLASFAVTSVLLRPLIGHWTDTWSDGGILASGLLFLGGSVLLCFIPVTAVTMAANALRGIGWAGLNTGGYALLARTAPSNRRGEASGYYTGAQSSAGVVFPAIALWLINAPAAGFGAVIIVSAAFAIIGGGIALVLPRYLSGRSVSRQSSQSPGKEERAAFTLVERDVLLATALLFSLNLSFPAVNSFLVVHARQIGIRNFGWFFVLSGLTSVLARPLLGRVSDKIGWGRSLVSGFVLEILALLLLVVASDLPLILTSGVLYALGSAIGTATTLALAMKWANPLRRGRAMATFSVAYPLSVGIGALLSGGAVQIAGYAWMFLIVALLELAGLAYAFTHWSSLK